MPEEMPIVDLAHAIQLAVAPVFLLTGVSAILGVMTNRLARIIDRTRVLEDFTHKAANETAQMELLALRRRAVLINWAIGLCTFSALLVAGVVAAIFLGTFVSFNFSPAVAAAFVVAMVSLMAGLLLFLREIHVALRFMRSMVGGE